MIVDNTEQIKKLIDNCGPGEFYMINIIHRKKDGRSIYNIDRLGPTHIVTSFYITSIKELDDKMAEIKDLCKLFNARAYININKKNWKKTTLNAIETISSSLIQEKVNKYWYEPLKYLLNEPFCGRSEKGSNLWFFDVDTKDMTIFENIKTLFNNTELGSDKIIDVIQTVNGYHIFTKPFDLKLFRELYTEHISVCANRPTLLYANINN